MNAHTLSRVAPKLIVGLAILSLGMLWTLDNLNVLESDYIVDYWPVAVIAIGLVKLADSNANKSAGILLVVLGGLLLLNTLDITDWDLGDLFPLAIALFGAKIIYDAVTRDKRLGRDMNALADADAEIHAFAMLAGVKRQSTASDFRGGSANAIMGGVELDLRSAKIAPGQRAIIDGFALWGGVEIKVPENWKVIGEVLPIMGAFEDKTAAKGETAGPVLIVRGTALMGGIEVKN